MRFDFITFLYYLSLLTCTLTLFLCREDILMTKFYPIASPILNGNEKQYVMDCLDSNWISSNGSYIQKFEEQFAQYCGVKHAISCSNGTTALHLALLAYGIKEGDEVIIPTFTFVATANAVVYCGGTPIFIDSDSTTWNIDPAKIEAKITPHTKGIIPVHIYGHPADMDPIKELAKKYNLFVIEDAAQAVGAQYKGKMTGAIGDCATFSLFGNKIITTGEGGIITTNDDHIAEKIRILKSQGIDLKRKYWFPVIGYNYRMTNIQAAIGCAQLENINWHIQQRIRIANQYTQNLKNDHRLILPIEKEWAKNVYWMFSIICKDFTENERNLLMDRLKDKGIETRPFFYPMHALPPYQNLQDPVEFPIINRISAQGINVPSYGSLTDDDTRYISLKITETLNEINT